MIPDFTKNERDVRAQATPYAGNIVTFLVPPIPFLMKILSFFLLLSGAMFLIHCGPADDRSAPAVPSPYRVWHPLTLTFTGEETLDEQGRPNPFLDFRLQVTFRQGERRFEVPGYFAADGRAAHSGATAGNQWRVHFTPDAPGTWQYVVSFRKGAGVAIEDGDTAGEAGDLDGLRGEFEVAPSDKEGRDLRAHGRLQYVGERYLRFAGSGQYYLKGGADSPENFLAYTDFDATYLAGKPQPREGESAPNPDLHAYAAHLDDWNAGDPSWRDGRGKGIIGALNYLAAKGMNVVYMLTMNRKGDGNEIWPWTGPDERFRFDCSKLDQWDIVFDHMDSLGLMLHFVLQETENETLLDGGDLGPERKLYLRELAARFAHHLAITWNLGEEHGPADWTPDGQTVEQTKDMAAYLRATDPYDHFIVVHTHADNQNRDRLMTPLLGFEAIEGPSIQAGDPYSAHSQTLKWLRLSAESGHPWVVCLDEIGPHWQGALPDAIDPAHDTIRQQVLWGNLMAGGGGVEWYFGYRFDHNDLNMEDWRSRDRLWDQTRHALHFFQEYLPFPEMQNHDDLLSGSEGYCLALAGEVYALYLLPGGRPRLDLSDASGRFSVQWYNPRLGGKLQPGSTTQVEGGKPVSLGNPPGNTVGDWAVLVKQMK